MASLMRMLASLTRLLTLPVLRAVGGVIVAIAVPLSRALAGVCLIVAAVALASDMGPGSLSRQRSIEPTSVIRNWQQIAPSSLEAVQSFLVKRTRPWIWDAFSAPLRLPSFVFFAALGLLFGYLGRHRQRVNIFAN
jgi:hypothetical protein